MMIRQFRITGKILSWFVSWSDKKQPVGCGNVYYEAHIKYYFDQLTGLIQDTLEKSLRVQYRLLDTP